MANWIGMSHAMAEGADAQCKVLSREALLRIGATAPLLLDLRG
jgi:hypothetical protein